MKKRQISYLGRFKFFNIACTYVCKQYGKYISPTVHVDLPLLRLQKQKVVVENFNLSNTVEDRVWHTSFVACDCLIFYYCGYINHFQNICIQFRGSTVPWIMVHDKPILNVFCISFWRLFSQISRRTLSKKVAIKRFANFLQFVKTHRSKI